MSQTVGNDNPAEQPATLDADMLSHVNTFIREMESLQDFARGCWIATRTREEDYNAYWVIYTTIMDRVDDITSALEKTT